MSNVFHAVRDKLTETYTYRNPYTKQEETGRRLTGTGALLSLVVSFSAIAGYAAIVLG